MLKRLAIAYTQYIISYSKYTHTHTHTHTKTKKKINNNPSSAAVVFWSSSGAQCSRVSASSGPQAALSPAQTHWRCAADPSTLQRIHDTYLALNTISPHFWLFVWFKWTPCPTTTWSRRRSPRRWTPASRVSVVYLPRFGPPRINTVSVVFRPQTVKTALDPTASVCNTDRPISRCFSVRWRVCDALVNTRQTL